MWTNGIGGRAAAPRWRVAVLMPGLLVAAWPGGAGAQEAATTQAGASEASPAPAGGEAAGEALREAAEHYQAGMAAYRRRAFREAIRRFRLAADRVPSADLWFNIARAHEELGEYDQAIEHYRRYLREKVDPPDREQVERHVEALREQAERLRAIRQRAPTTGVVQVRSNVRGARIELDGEPSGRTPLPVPLVLPAGDHDLRLQADGYVPFQARVGVYPGVTTGVYADLVPRTVARSVRGTPLWTWVAAGLGVVAAGASAWLGVRALGLRNDGDLQGARDVAARSDLALGTALGLGLGAVVLYFVETRAVETRLERAVPRDVDGGRAGSSESGAAEGGPAR